MKLELYEIIYRCDGGPHKKVKLNAPTAFDAAERLITALHFSNVKIVEVLKC